MGITSRSDSISILSLRKLLYHVFRGEAPSTLSLKLSFFANSEYNRVEIEQRFIDAKRSLKTLSSFEFF